MPLSSFVICICTENSAGQKMVSKSTNIILQTCTNKDNAWGTNNYGILIRLSVHESTIMVPRDFKKEVSNKIFDILCCHVLTSLMFIYIICNTFFSNFIRSVLLSAFCLKSYIWILTFPGFEPRSPGCSYYLFLLQHGSTRVHTGDWRA